MKRFLFSLFCGEDLSLLIKNSLDLLALGPRLRRSMQLCPQPDRCSCTDIFLHKQLISIKISFSCIIQLSQHVFVSPCDDDFSASRLLPAAADLMLMFHRHCHRADSLRPVHRAPGHSHPRHHARRSKQSLLAARQGSGRSGRTRHECQAPI